MGTTTRRFAKPVIMSALRGVSTERSPLKGDTRSFAHSHGVVRPGRRARHPRYVPPAAAALRARRRLALVDSLLQRQVR